LSLERRRTPRIPFVATSEIIDEAENTRTTSQLSDLGLHGCFVQLPNPFPEGTPDHDGNLQRRGFRGNVRHGRVPPAKARYGTQLYQYGAALCFRTQEMAFTIESYRPPGLKRDIRVKTQIEQRLF
jgi:hypothetical protein